MHRMGFLAALAAVTVLLSGCTSWKNGSYTSVTPHQEAHGQQKPEEAEVVSDYETLKAFLLELIESAVPDATMDVSQYGKTLEQDVKTVTRELLGRDPLAAYAVERLEIVPTEVGARQLATVTVSYRRTWEQIRAIETTWGLKGVNRHLGLTLEAAEPELVLQVNGYQDMDVEELVTAYCEAHPDTVVERPQIVVSVYPQTGATRIVEIQFSYSQSQEALQSKAKELQIMLSSAEGYARGQELEQDRAKRLISFLRPLLSEEGETATPVYSLLCQGVGTSRSVAEVYRLLCGRVGLACYVVEGTRDGVDRCWNILCLDGVYCHTDVTADWGDGESALRFDEEMENYDWDREAYPVCAKPQEPNGQTDQPGQGEQPPEESQPPEETWPTEETEPPEETEPDTTEPEP